MVTHSMNFSAAPFGGLCHHPEVTHALVLPRLGVAQRAGVALVAHRMTSCREGERREADRVFVRVTLVGSCPLVSSDAAPGEIFGFAPRKMFWKASWVPEEENGPRVIRAADFRARNFPPFAHVAREDLLHLCWLRFLIGFSGLVMMHTPSRATFVNVAPWVRADDRVAEASPMSTRPLLTSLMPTPEVPCPTLGVGWWVALW